MFMVKKDHFGLSKVFEAKFPELFGFESCGLLMMGCDGVLFRITTPSNVLVDGDGDGEANPEVTLIPSKMTPMIIRLPKDRGLTG